MTGPSEEPRPKGDNGKGTEPGRDPLASARGVSAGEGIADILLMLDSQEAEVRIQACNRLSNFPEKQTIEALVKHLGEDASSEVRVAAANSLGVLRNSPLGNAAESCLLLYAPFSEARQDRDCRQGIDLEAQKQIRLAIFEALAGSDNPAVIQAVLFDTLDSDWADTEEKSAAIRSAALSDNDQALERIRVELLEGEGFIDVEVACAQALSGLRNNAIIQALISRFKDTDPMYLQVRRACAQALAGSDSAQSREVLAEGLSDRDEKIRDICRIYLENS